jgi:hypothetical protein
MAGTARRGSIGPAGSVTTPSRKPRAKFAAVVGGAGAEHHYDRLLGLFTEPSIDGVFGPDEGDPNDLVDRDVAPRQR